MAIRQQGRRIRPVDYPTWWRRYAMHLWSAPSDPTISVTFEFDVSAALDYLERVNRTSPLKLTVTHLFAKAIGLALERHPELNVRIVRRRIYPLPRVDLGMPALVNDGQGLYWFRIDGVNAKTLLEVAREVADQAEHAQERVDALLNRFHGIPLALACRMLAGLKHRFDFDPQRIGLPDPTMPPVVLSSAGSYASFVSTSGALPSVTGVLANMIVGGVEKKPVVRDDQVVIRPMLPFVITTEHRVVDGFHAIRYARFVENVLREPAKHFGEPVAAGAG